MVKYYPKNYIPIYGGGESLLHFILRCLFCRALYVKNLELRENDGQVLFESEKEFFSDKKYRGDVYDPFTCVLYEIQKDRREIRRKIRIFNRSSEIEVLLAQVWDEIEGVIETI